MLRADLMREGHLPNSYEYGIYNEGGAMKGFTVKHSWIWGLGGDRHGRFNTGGTADVQIQLLQGFCDRSVLRLSHRGHQLTQHEYGIVRDGGSQRVFIRGQHERDRLENGTYTRS